MGSLTTHAGTACGELGSGRRVLLVDLGAPGPDGAERAGAHLGAFSRAISSAPDLARSAARSGPALALAAFVAAHRAERSLGPREPAFAITVGDAVRRRVPTAARATITALAPLRHGLAEAQFGGSFGAAFGQAADMLIVVGRAAEPVVLRIGRDGSVDVAAAREVLGEDFASLPTRQRARALSEFRSPGRRGAHVLTVGPGADAGLPFANLASFDGDDLDGAPSIVGRGGLGATVGRAGVVAITIESEPVTDPVTEAESPGDSGSDLRTLLTSSPRLLARSVGGTLELGSLREGEVDVGTSGREKHGCRGCPTPCGWRFDVKVRGGGARVSSRFAALQGFAGHGDVLALVERCNDLGIDARSAATLYGAEPRDLDPDAFLDAMVVRGTVPHGEAIAVGATPGLEPEPGKTYASADLAARVGQALAARGPEPVRSLSVFGLGGVEPAALVAPLPWSGDRETDAGTLAYWHECFAAAIDITGFCAFSAAALVADGLADIAALEDVLRPHGDRSGGWGLALGDGRALLIAGAEHVALHRELAGPTDDPRSVEIERELPVAVAAYRRAVLRGFGHGAESDHPATAPAGVRSLDEDLGAMGGVVLVRASGILAARLAGCPGRRAGTSEDGLAVIEIEVPPVGLTAVELLGSLAILHPPAARWLVDPKGRPIPAVVVADAMVPAGGNVLPGSVAELVLAIPGG